MTAAVIVSIRVGATPLRAFEAFTEEIGEWWRPNPLFALTPRGDGDLRFEPGEGGRLVATLANGKEFEVGRITVWKPGERLALTWRHATFARGQSTQLDVRLRSGGERDARDGRASRLERDPAGSCRTSRLRADTVPAPTS
jgi:uncharacterized protein YndB with AHSA1/START domain